MEEKPQNFGKDQVEDIIEEVQAFKRQCRKFIDFSDTPVEKYIAKLRSEWDSEFSDFENFEDDVDLVREFSKSDPSDTLELIISKSLAMFKILDFRDKKNLVKKIKSLDGKKKKKKKKGEGFDEDDDDEEEEEGEEENIDETEEEKEKKKKKKEKVIDEIKEFQIRDIKRRRELLEKILLYEEKTTAEKTASDKDKKDEENLKKDQNKSP